MSEAERLRLKYETLVERYNREYRAGRWSTNRPLASKCEDAYSAWQDAVKLEELAK